MIEGGCGSMGGCDNGLVELNRVPFLLQIKKIIHKKMGSNDNDKLRGDYIFF